MVWEDSVARVALWLQEAVILSFAPWPKAVIAHGLARPHRRPWLRSRPQKHVGPAPKTTGRLPAQEDTPRGVFSVV
jgi:hypothetical protein